MQHNGKAFMLEIEAMLARTASDSARIVADATVEVFGDVVNETPVDTGQARSNWRLSVESYDTSTTQGATRNAISEAEGAVTAHFSSNDLFTFISITNNLPYIYTLEYGRSGQAPNGMFRKNLNRWPQVINKHAKRRR